MTDECISPLVAAQIERMTVQFRGQDTDRLHSTGQEHCHFSWALARYCDPEDVRRYLLHLASSGMGAGVALA